MNDDYAILKQKLNNYYNKNISDLNNFTELKKSIIDLVNDINDNNDKTKDIDSIIKDRIVEQYELEKEGITFGALIERTSKNLVVSVIIFDVDVTYSNLLVRTYNFNQLDEAKKYFSELKTLIVDCNVSELSNIILKKMWNNSIYMI